MDVWGVPLRKLSANNQCFWTVVLEKTLQSPLDSKEIKPVNPKGNQPWIFIGRTDDEAEVLILWPPDVKSQLTGKDPDAGKDWEQEEKGVTENEMVTDSRDMNLSKTPEDNEGQGRLVGCSPWWWQGVRPNLTTEKLQNKTPPKWCSCSPCSPCLPFETGWIFTLPKSPLQECAPEEVWVWTGLANKM